MIQNICKETRRRTVILERYFKSCNIQAENCKKMVNLVERKTGILYNRNWVLPLVWQAVFALQRMYTYGFQASSGGDCAMLWKAIEKGQLIMFEIIGAIGAIATVLSTIINVLTYVQNTRNDKKQKSNRPRPKD